MSFLDELKRRKVFRVAASYAVVAFIIMQLVEIVFPIFEFPQWTSQFVIILVLIGFPISVILSWVFDRTPQGYIKTDSKKDLDKEPEIKSNGSESFLKNKKNWLLVVGIIAGILIGRFGQTSTSAEKIVNEKSIAVLPFDNLGSDEDDEYFADGMTEDILTELSKIKDLLVISRTTIMKYKNSNKSLKEIGKELGVANILEGSIRRVGERVRITGQLINAISDKHLWAEKYDRNIEDIFEVQDEVASAIANALRIELSDEESRLITSSQTSSIDAYDLYVKARSLSYTYDLNQMIESIKLFKEAIKIDQNYALAYAGISRARAMQSYFQYYDADITSIALKESEEYAKKGIQLGPNEADAHFAMGFYYNRTEEYDLAYESFMTAINLNPSHAHAHDEVGDVYQNKYGDLDKALVWYQKALKRDPALPPANWLSIEIALKKGQVKKALSLADDALIQHPKVVSFYTLKNVALIMKGDYQSAYDFIFDKEEVYRSGGRLLEFYQALGYTLMMLNRTDDLNKNIKILANVPHSNRTHHQRYLKHLSSFLNKDYNSTIRGFENLIKSEFITQAPSQRYIVEDASHYWRARSFLELGDYDKVLLELGRFRPTHNEMTVPILFDQFWPKQYYLKGLAYEKLGDVKNASESYKEFLQVWEDADEDLPEIIDAKKRLRNLGLNS